jgi:HD-GYP domain-containing protein (c-di-GMP phosphodiesterase class II)
MGSILLLGEDKSQTSPIESLLRQDRHTVYVLRHVWQWSEAESEREFELIIAAMGRSECLDASGNRRATGFPTPILLVQQSPEPPKAMHGHDRVVDWISIPFTAEDFLARVDALIRMQGAVRRLRAERGIDDDASRSRAAREHRFQRFKDQLSAVLGARLNGFSRPLDSYTWVANRVAAWADRRDAFEPGHADRVAVYAALIADVVGLSADHTATTLHAARLHDIGKIALPIGIIRQRGPLAEEQKRLLQTHPQRGAKILISLNAAAATVEAVRLHHVRFDEQQHDSSAVRGALLPARIIAAAEVYDAMTTKMFSPAVSKEVALERMRDLRGGQLDPVCVDALIEALTPRSTKVRVAAVDAERVLAHR